MCCSSLCGNDRLLAAWPAPEHAVILAVGPHDRSALDLYQMLLAALSVDVPCRTAEQATVLRRTAPPPADAQLAEALAAAVTAFDSGRRRRVLTVTVGRPAGKTVALGTLSFSCRCCPHSPFGYRYSPHFHTVRQVDTRKDVRAADMCIL